MELTKRVAAVDTQQAAIDAQLLGRMRSVSAQLLGTSQIRQRFLRAIPPREHCAEVVMDPCIGA